MAIKLLCPFRTVVSVQRFYFPYRSRIYAIENGFSEGVAIFVHADDVRTHHADSKCRHLFTGDAGFGEKPAGYRAQILPHDLVGVTFKIVFLRVFDLVGD